MSLLHRNAASLKCIVAHFFLLALPLNFLNASPDLPEFSWETVPRYMHVRKTTAFTSKELAYLATFPLITFEKTTGSKEFGSTERGTEIAARSVKAINPKTKILYYRNIFVHYNVYAADRELKNIESPFVSDLRNGNTRLVRNKVPGYDLSNQDLRSWWLKNAKEVCASDHIDGLFIDGNIKVLEKGYLRRQIGEEKKSAVIKGYHDLMAGLPTTLGPKKLIIGNTIRARFDQAGLEYLTPLHGSYIEGFEHTVGRTTRADYVAKGIAAIQKAARAGKIIAFTIGSGSYADTDMDEKTLKSRAKKSRHTSSQKRFEYALALFLISAEKYSYFMFADGYSANPGETRGWMTSHPEYQTPLGPPKGPAKKSGYRYTRSFQFADVTIDIDQETANILWKKN